MNYTKPSFTVPVSSGAGKCQPFQHTMADIHGRCLRCGDRIPTRDEQLAAQMKHQHMGCGEGYHAFELDAPRCDCGKATPPDRWLGWKR